MGYKHVNSKGVTYYLNSKEVTLRGGKKQRCLKDKRLVTTKHPKLLFSRGCFVFSQ
jgi:hypothetical protein